MKRREFVIASVYDTETTNIGENENTRAFPILFIDNDIRDVDLLKYTPDKDDKVNFYRHEQEMQARIDEYVFWGECLNVIPIICAYNLMFDLQPLMEDLNARYGIKANAQSSTNVYTLDLYDGEKQVLRFWDTYHLEMRGLAAMGTTAGLRKANGDWDYTKTRTPETNLTAEELFYAKRDTQVIPAYLSYLLRANEWMQQSDLGVRVLTKTSIVRQMARREIERLTVPKRDGSRLELRNAFMRLCKKELPCNYQIYALRKACFRGGFTFTSARYAMTLQRNVISADAVSMHHEFINGRYVPQDFKVCSPADLRAHFDNVLSRTLDDVLHNYHKPFECAFHARVKFTNIRLRKNSCFDVWGIALESTSKFKKGIEAGNEIGFDPLNVAQENSVRSNGFYDRFDKATFAFGKLYKADEVILHINELELWTLSRVYEWDEIIPIFGEATCRFKLPPDFVTLQSNKLYKQKSAAKYIHFHYEKGVPYKYDTKYMPDGIAFALRDGTMEPQFFEQYYTNTVKGMFNGIYGTMAQDVFKPSYKCENGTLVVDETTITTPENYDEKKPRSTRVLYTYGMRIVGGSRMHLVILIELLYNALGERIRILGGDTDSVKVSCDTNVSNEEIEAAMESLAIASKEAIDTCMARLRQNFPDLASSLDGVGSFEIENRNEHYMLHYEMWNKARISFDGKNTHITCAGLPRPIGLYTIETFMDELIEAGYPPEKVLQETIGFDTFISNEISHTLEHHKPKPTDVYDGLVTDYNGVQSQVFAHESVALYPSGRWLGETLKLTNRLTLDYINSKYSREIDTASRYLERGVNGKAVLKKDTENGVRKVMCA